MVGGSSTSFKFSTTKDSQKLMMYMQSSYSMAPLPEFLDPPLVRVVKERIGLATRDYNTVRGHRMHPLAGPYKDMSQ